MKIGQIRDVLSFAAFSCSDLRGYTRSELLRYDVPTHLGKQIDALQALEIAPRFVRDCARREELIVRCRVAIERWQELQGRSLQEAPVPTAILQ